MKHVGKQLLFFFQLILWCKSFRSGGNTCHTLFMKDDGSCKGCSVLLSGHFFPFLRAILACYIQTAKGPCIPVQVKAWLQRRSFAGKTDQVTWSWLLTISVDSSEGLKQWDGISLGFSEFPTKNVPSETRLRAFPMWGAKLFTCHKPDIWGSGQCTNGHYKAVGRESGNSVGDPFS